MRLPIVLLGFCLATGLVRDSCSQSVEAPQPIALRDGWQYRYGDSPVDSSGNYSWTYLDLSNHAWQPTDKLHVPAGNEAQSHYLWVRVKLPAVAFPRPVLYLPHIHLHFEAYMDSTLIYQSGEPNQVQQARFMGSIWHLLPLPEPFAGRVLNLRIYSQSPSQIGINDYNDYPRLGTELGIIELLLRDNIDSTTLGFLFVSVGLFSLFVFFRRVKTRSLFALSFAGLTIAMGLFYILNDKIGFMLFGASDFVYYISFISFFLFPVGIYSFLQQILAAEYRWIVRPLWVIHLVIGVLFCISDIINIMMLQVAADYHLWLFLSTMLVALIVGCKAAVEGNYEVRIFILGFFIFALLGINDILLGLRLVSDRPWVSHWGVLIFIGFLGYILERRFARDQAQLQAYSRDLEKISDTLKESKSKLERYSHTLEEKVDARTRDISSKNEELNKALQQLTEAQDQLVLKEKMASLGNLVAGIAHEVNTPIGAVKSAADVGRRCIQRIKEKLSDESPAACGVVDDPDFKKALKLLEDNNNVVNLASERVARIVRSLKNFARLDEAELQKADIHQGLDSTLTLINHEIKNRITIVRNYGLVPAISCFPNQLNQVFVNLLMNAVHAIDEKGEITITTSVRNGAAHIEFADNGCGISPERIGQVFDPGFTTKGVGVGTGLGLSISYNIIAKHKGKISVESEVGKGTTFTVSLPLD